MPRSKTVNLLLTVGLVAAVTVAGFAVTSRQAKAADPSSVPIRPVTYDAVYVVNGGNGETSSISVITNQLANTVSAIDVRSRRVKATIAVGEKPNGLVFRSR